MRVVLMLAVLLPLLAFVSYIPARAYLRRTKRRRHIRELEAENRQLDSVINLKERTRHG